MSDAAEEPEFPRSRREARAHRGRPVPETTTPSNPRSHRTRSRRRRAFTAVLIGTAALVLVVGAGAALLYVQASSVRSHLTAAMSSLTTVQSAILAADRPAATAAAAQLSDDTAAAVDTTGNPLWALAAKLPVIGDDLAAVRSVAVVVDQLARDVIDPATSIDLDTFRPVDGRMDLDALSTLAPTIDRIAAGVASAVDTMATIDRSQLTSQVATGVNMVDEALSKATPLLAPLRDLAHLLPDALGAAGPRDYLLMFQGNSEARSLGGNAAVFIVVRADAGRLEITGLADSSDFAQPTPEPVASLDPEAVAIFGDKIGKYTPDFTMVPDFPSAASIMQGWWAQLGPTDFDGMVSVDPVALSYLLRATGPLTLPTGDALTADNAVPLLLNEVYFRYEDPMMQNAFFAGAASSVFSALTSGAFAPDVLMAALAQAVDERRLLYQTDDADEAALVSDSPLAGTFPPDTANATKIGVFVNDNTGSKKSYYLDMSTTLCRGEGTMEGTTTLTSMLDAATASRLPYYITGPYYAPADISTYVAIYGPTGGTLKQISVDGAPVQPISSGQHLGRPVVKVEVQHHLDSVHSIRFAFTPPQGAAGELGLVQTPLSRESPVHITDQCAP
ncbi:MULTISPECIES: DUF4012 domain-containing protein [unclassified Microbacterium]|uniref:DUF4012 domain-containing protein n=1 Tax=unclassified Microbacterium TaxID=2609290 RepID=UPI0028AA0AD0|nr:DUF4012 domain-containing protein [Microbacterium sp.]